MEHGFSRIEQNYTDFKYTQRLQEEILGLETRLKEKTFATLKEKERTLIKDDEKHFH